jgi:hypothetical protein
MLVFGLISGLVCGFTSKVIIDKTSPNQGIKLSWKNSFVAFLVVWLIVGTIIGLTVGLGKGLFSGPSLGCLPG